MPASSTVLAISGTYLLTCLVLGMLPGARSSDSAAGYVAGDRALGLILMYFITGATIFSAFAFLGGPGWTYSKGAAAFYILGYGSLGLVPFYFLGPRAARTGRTFGFVTQAQMVASRFGMPTLAALMAVISLMAFVPYLALQMTGAGYVLNAMTRGAVPAWAGGLGVYAVVTLYVLRSGVLGVGWTNTFQGVFMIVLAWILGLYLPYELYGGVEELFERLARERPEMLRAPGLDDEGNRWTWGEYSSAVVVSIVGFSMWPHLFMKAFSARSDNTLRRTVLLYPTFQVFSIPLFIIGFCGVFFESEPPRPDQILPHMLMNMELPGIAVGLFCAGALAASMSSGDAMAHAAGSIAVRDGWLVSRGRTLEPHRERRWIQAVIVAVMLLSYGMSLLAIFYEISLVTLLLSAYGAVVQFAPAVALALYARWPSARGVLLGMIAGAAVTILFTLVPALRPWPLHAGVYGLAVNCVLVVVWSRIRPPPRDSQVDRFLEIAATPESRSEPF